MDILFYSMYMAEKMTGEQLLKASKDILKDDNTQLDSAEREKITALVRERSEALRSEVADNFEIGGKKVSELLKLPNLELQKLLRDNTEYNAIIGMFLVGKGQLAANEIRSIEGAGNSTFWNAINLYRKESDYEEPQTKIFKK